MFDYLLKLTPPRRSLLPEIPHAPRHDDRFLDRDQRPKKIKPHPLPAGGGYRIASAS